MFVVCALLLGACRQQPAKTTSTSTEDPNISLIQTYANSTMRTNGSYVIHEGTLVISEEFQIVKKCNEATEESNVPDAGRGVTKETILTEFPEAKPNDTDLVQSFSRELPDAKFTVEGEELTLTAKDFKETFTFTDKNHKKVRDQQGIEYDVS